MLNFSKIQHIIINFNKIKLYILLNMIIKKLYYYVYHVIVTIIIL